LAQAIRLERLRERARRRRGAGVMAHCQRAQLEAIIRAIYSAAPTTSEARRLAARVLGASAPADATPEVHRKGAIESLDETLAVVKRAARCDGVVDISTAKAWLRGFGTRGKRAAAGLGKLSSMRNAAAHPLAKQLQAEIEMIADTSSGGPTGDETEEAFVNIASGEGAEEEVTSETSRSGGEEPSGVQREDLQSFYIGEGTGTQGTQTEDAGSDYLTDAEAIERYGGPQLQPVYVRVPAWPSTADSVRGLLEAMSLAAEKAASGFLGPSSGFGSPSAQQSGVTAAQEWQDPEDASRWNCKNFNLNSGAFRRRVLPSESEEQKKETTRSEEDACVPCFGRGKGTCDARSAGEDMASKKLVEIDLPVKCDAPSVEVDMASKLVEFDVPVKTSKAVRRLHRELTEGFRKEVVHAVCPERHRLVVTATVPEGRCQNCHNAIIGAYVSCVSGGFVACRQCALEMCGRMEM
jgi:hypothetical protein